MKKGVSQIDWAISLGVFVIFLAIFFILVHPLFIAEPETTSVTVNTVSKFKYINEPDNVVWSVNKLPLYFESSSDEIRAVSFKFPYSWDTSNTSFQDNRQFWIDESRIFFLQDLNSSAVLVNSDYNYTQNEELEIGCSSTSVDIDEPDFELTILDGELEEIDFDGNTKADNIDLLESGTANFTNQSFVCKYTKGDHDFYVIANDSIIFSFFDSEIAELEMDLAENTYEYYYDGSSHTIPYDDDNCTNKSNLDILDFYDTDGIAFSSDNFNATFCYENQSGTLKLNLSLVFTDWYKIVLHEDDYGEATKYTNTKIIQGMMQPIKGLSYEKLEELNQSRTDNYTALKESWGITGEFDWKIVNKTQ
jgi:hypothetical protein